MEPNPPIPDHQSGIGPQRLDHQSGIGPQPKTSHDVVEQAARVAPLPETPAQSASGEMRRSVRLDHETSVSGGQKDDYLTEMCSGSEEGSYSRPIDFCVTQL